MNILKTLKGYKTYLTAAAGILGTAAGVAAGTVSPANGAIAAAVLAATAFQRAGSKSDTTKVIAHVNSVAAGAAELAPLIAALIPGAASIAGKAGQIAVDVAEASAARAV